MDIKTLVLWLVEEGGLTQKQIAERTGFSGATISDVAAGKIGHTRPSYGLVTKLQELHAEVVAKKARAARKASA